jgi:hypothetical protein
MKLILITLVAVVVGMMVACESASRTSMFIPTSTPAPVAVPPPAYSDAEIIAAVKTHLTAGGKHEWCSQVARDARHWTVEQSEENPNNFLVESLTGGSRSGISTWTVILPALRVLQTSPPNTGSGFNGC